ncbi:MAG: ATP-binding cassette domain-containing protein, partial [Alphaproteobacteria bacterium]
MSEPLLQVEALRVEFNTRDGVARVIDDLDIALNSGEILGIVGESGCGKSMTALSIMGLVPSPPGRITSGTIRLADENLLEASEQRMREVRGNDISMIFQEPMTS